MSEYDGKGNVSQGYPRIIPSFIRKQMYKKDDKADLLVRIWLSLFSVYKIVLLAKKVRKAAFESNQ